MVFFLSVGLLIDLKFIADNLGTVLVLLLIVTLFKTALNIGIMRFLGETWQRASLQGLTLSQLGEFSFLLAATGLAAGAIGEEQSRLVIAVTVLSLAASPLWLTSARRVHGLASRQIDTLQELVDAAYGDEVKVVQRGSRRFVLMTRILLRTGWDRAATRFPALARIKAPHRRGRGQTRLLPPPRQTDTGKESDDAPDTEAGQTTSPAPDDKSAGAERSRKRPKKKDPLTALGDQVRAAVTGGHRKERSESDDSGGDEDPPKNKPDA